MYWTIASAEYAGTPENPNDNWAGDMFSIRPDAVTHNSDNRIFTAPPTNYDGELLQIPEVSEKLNLNAIAMLVGKWMLAEDRSLPIVGTKGQISFIAKHPMWRLWCNEHKDEESLKLDWDRLKAILDELRPDLSAKWPEYTDSYTTEDIRDVISKAVSSLD